MKQKNPMHTTLHPASAIQTVGWPGARDNLELNIKATPHKGKGTRLIGGNVVREDIVTLELAAPLVVHFTAELTLDDVRRLRIVLENAEAELSGDFVYGQ